MDTATKGEIHKLQCALLTYLRPGMPEYLGGGMAMQKNAKQRIGALHRATADMDIVRTDEVRYKHTYTILPEHRFNVDMINSGFLSLPFPPVINAAKQDSEFSLIMDNKVKARLTYSGEFSFESIDTALASKAVIISDRLGERKGEIAKDLFDIATMCGFVDATVVDRAKSAHHHTREIFYLSSSIVSLYPKSISKRVASELPEEKVRELAEMGRKESYSSESELREFTRLNGAVLPALLLAGANECVKPRVPTLIIMSQGEHPVVTYANAEILGAIRSNERKKLDAVINVLIHNVREVRQNGSGQAAN